jgi:mono/diheme cytochrome c family protein
VVEPTPIEGVVVERATLHNFDEIDRKDIRIGDKVIILRSGDVIPKIVKVLTHERDGSQVPYVRPTLCPVCNSELLDEGALTKCQNLTCSARVVNAIIYFASKPCLNIDGLGDKIVETLYNEGLVKSVIDLYALTLDQLLALEGFKEKKSQKLLAAIEGSKGCECWRFLNALGMEHIGEVASKSLCAHFGLRFDEADKEALAAYITWLSTGMPVAMNAKRSCSPLISDQWAEAQERFAALLKKATHANYLSGQKIYANKCAMCHGTEGQGMDTMPPLWGKNADGKWLAYNAGGGMSKLNKAAAWVQVNMPFGQGGTLSDQEASDVMLFVDAQPRSGFDLKKALLRDAGEGIYNSDIRSEYDSVRSNFKLLGLDIDTVRGDKKIP